ncbi:tetratricopeptide repeat protein [Actinopolymorpha alba]|uniref:tetratricopeptide repeat protein n=1 Tax=Actinopolymorpha alba TaxID=533267 RepID=UPI0003A03FDF|nr:tetratricopeptide repeat protein [Actinopolymorpha alba]
MAGGQDDSTKPAAPRGRGWTRSLAIFGLLVLALAALTETVTAGSARRLVGGLFLLALAAFAVAGLGWLFEPKGQRAEREAEQRQQHEQRQQEQSRQQGQRTPGQGDQPERRTDSGQSAAPRDQRSWTDSSRTSQEAPRTNLPRLSELADVALGPTPTRYTLRGHTPYVKRPATDSRLATLLTTGGPPYPFVVVVGASKAGKSRTALEAVRTAFGSRDPSVVIPENGEQLAEQLRSEPRSGERLPWVVWLDDATAAELTFLSTDVLDLASDRAVLVATMTEGRWDQITGSRSDVAATARAALRRATRVPLDFELTRSERAEAEQLYPQERILASLAEALVGGEQLVEKFQAGREAEPAGYTIAQAAVDARRAGLNRPITESELRSLYPLYLRRVRIDLDPTTELFEAGMAWAKEPVDSGVALLRPGSAPGTFEVFDHAVAVEESPGSELAGPVLDAMWRELIAAVPAQDAFEIGLGACVSDNPDAAESAFRKVVSADHAVQAPRATLHLGQLLRERGDIPGARSAYQRAADSGHTDVAPRAALSLGSLLREQGDIAGARSAYQRAADSGHTDVAPRAALSLGSLLREQGDIAGARSAYQRAADSGHTDVVPRASLNLGTLLREQGDVAGAEVAYQRAADSGHPEVVPTAALNLGTLLKERGDLVRAQAAYQRAVDSGDSDAVPRASLNLGLLLKERGDLVRARAAYQRAVDSGQPEVVPTAALNLGVLLAEQGDVAGAEAAYQRAIASGDSDIVPMAALHRGSLLKENGDLHGARSAYQQAIDSDHRDVAPRAANNLGVLLAQQDEVSDAKAAYQRAIDSGHREVAPMAANNLGVLLARMDDVPGAKAAYQRAIDSGHSDVAPRALLNLGMLLNEQGDLMGARAAYQRAVDSGHKEVVPMASVNLGVLLAKQDDVAGARAAFHRAIDAGYVDIMPVASDNLRMLMTGQGDAVTTQQAQPLPVDASAPETAPLAAKSSADADQGG